MSDSLLVTGASGFTGQHFLEYVSANQDNIVSTSISRQARQSKYGKVVQCDLFDREKLVETLAEVRPKYIAHLAGATAPKSAPELWAANVGSTVGLIDSVVRADIQPRILIIGSAAEYKATDQDSVRETDATGGDSDYGLSKSIQVRCASDLAVEYGLELIVARTFNLIGPGLSDQFVGGAICSQVSAARCGKPMRVGRTDSVRDFIDVRDAVRAYSKLLFDPQPRGAFNVSTNIGTSIEALLQTTLQQAGVDDSLVIRESQTRDTDIDRMVGDYSKLSTATDWSPRIDVEQSISDMLKTYE